MDEYVFVIVVPERNGRNISKFKEPFQIWGHEIEVVFYKLKLPKDTHARGQPTLISRNYFYNIFQQETIIPVYKTIAISNIEPFHCAPDFIAQLGVVFVQS